jgi:AbrB family looped-hinge helix DNA binding protein
MSFSASANVAGVTSGPTEGPVPKAGGMPGGVGGEGAVGGACGWASAPAVGTRAALARPRAVLLRKSRRAVLMAGIVRDPGGVWPRIRRPAVKGIPTGYSVPLIWYPSGMKAAIDKAGRVVIPSEIRRRAGLQPGTKLDIVLEDDASVRLVRDTPGPRLHRVGRRLVARPTAKRDRLPEVDVVALLEEERSRWPW